MAIRLGALAHFAVWVCLDVSSLRLECSFNPALQNSPLIPTGSELLRWLSVCQRVCSYHISHHFGGGNQGGEGWGNWDVIHWDAGKDQWLSQEWGWILILFISLQKSCQHPRHHVGAERVPQSGSVLVVLRHLWSEISNGDSMRGLGVHEKTEGNVMDGVCRAPFTHRINCDLH